MRTLNRKKEQCLDVPSIHIKIANLKTITLSASISVLALIMCLHCKVDALKERLIYWHKH